MQKQPITPADISSYLRVNEHIHSLSTTMRNINTSEGSYFTSVILFSDGSSGYTTVKGDLFLFRGDAMDFFDLVKQKLVDEESWQEYLVLLHTGPNGVRDYQDEVDQLTTNYRHHGVVVTRSIAAIFPITE